MININIEYNQKIFEINIDKDNSVFELKKFIKEKIKVPIQQQRLEYIGRDSKIILKNNNMILSDIFQNFTQVNLKLKNIGKQIDYKTLFYLEYSIPLLIWTVFHFMQYDQMNSLKTILFILVLIHYFKRLFETKFVHVFSNGTAPLIHSLKNFFFYWILFGLCGGYEVLFIKSYREKNYSYLRWSLIIIFILIFLVCEFLNFYCHMKLRLLRTNKMFGNVPSQIYEKKIPYGLFFNSIISPNYTFEILAWISFVIISQSLSILIFIIFGSIIMYKWGKQKKQKLYNLKNNTVVEREEINKRKILIPKIL